MQNLFKFKTENNTIDQFDTRELLIFTKALKRFIQFHAEGVFQEFCELKFSTNLLQPKLVFFYYFSLKLLANKSIILRHKNLDLTEYMKPIVTKKNVKLLKVHYYHRTSSDEITVHLGNKLINEMILKEPAIFDLNQPNSYYTLLLVDPDEINIGPLDGRVYWLTYNLFHKKERSVRAPYIPPSAKQGFENHRYMFLMYKQNGLIKEMYSNSSLGSYYLSERETLYLKGFEKEFNLELVAANFFYCTSFDKIKKPDHKLYDREESEKPNGTNFNKEHFSEPLSMQTDDSKENGNENRRRFSVLENLNQALRNSKLNCFQT